MIEDPNKRAADCNISKVQFRYAATLGAKIPMAKGLVYYWIKFVKKNRSLRMDAIFLDQTRLACKYVIARRRSPCEIELSVDRTYNTNSTFYYDDVKNLILLQRTQIFKILAMMCIPLAPG